MMPQQSRRLLNAYLDGELDAASTIALEEEIDHAPELRRECQALNEFIEMVRRQGSRFAPPPELALRCLAALSEASPAGDPSDGSGRRRNLIIASGVVAAALLLFIGGLVSFFRSPSMDVTDEIVSAHARSLLVDHLTDVTSSDRHTVKPWLSNQLDFAPPLYDLSTAGFTIVGGRIDYVFARPVAAIVYQYREHLINLFVWPSADAAHGSGQEIVRRGYNLVRFQIGEISFWAISDLNYDDLGRFAKLFQSAPK